MSDTVSPISGDVDSGASAAEREVTGELVQGQLAGRTISVPAVKEWRASALKALSDGDFDLWAEKTLSDGDLDVWLTVDPKLREIEEFFGEINKGLGTTPGNSRASRRQSMRSLTR
jgi:hypothetical protein